MTAKTQGQLSAVKLHKNRKEVVESPGTTEQVNIPIHSENRNEGRIRATSGRANATPCGCSPCLDLGHRAMPCELQHAWRPHHCGRASYVPCVFFLGIAQTTACRFTQETFHISGVSDFLGSLLDLCFIPTSSGSILSGGPCPISQAFLWNLDESLPLHSTCC